MVTAKCVACNRPLHYPWPSGVCSRRCLQVMRGLPVGTDMEREWIAAGVPVDTLDLDALDQLDQLDQLDP